MSQYANLKATIAANVYQNHNNEVTANMVKAAMNAMTDSLGAGYQYLGIATPATTPGTPDQKVFYIAAQPGTYTNFGTGITVNDGEVAVLKYDTAWTKEVTGAALAASVTELTEGWKEICESIKGDAVTGTTHAGEFWTDQGIIRQIASTKWVLFPVDITKKYALNGLTLPTSDWGFISFVYLDANQNYLAHSNDGHYGPYEFVDVIVDNYPEGCAYIGANGRIDDTITLNEFEGWKLRDELYLKTRGALPSCDLNDVKENGFWILVDSFTYQNVPNNATLGFLRVSIAEEGRWYLQEFFDFSGGGYYKRRSGAGGNTWEDWQSVGGGGGTIINNNYEYNSYPQTINITATPVITSDTNQYLASTGDTTDRTADILALLSTVGTCHLGPGEFYVKNLIMPDNTTLIGSGAATKVVLDPSVTDGFAIKVGTNCSIHQFTMDGLQGAPHSTVGTRHGVLWEGDYTQSQTAPLASIISDLFIRNFNGGGITCYDTGYGTFNFLDVCNVIIDKCGAGINVSYWSEFHKFTNVRTYNCYFGCINNGGNNIFVNCDFSSCQGKAFVMDNSQGQSPNNSHGSCIGCVFNHTAANTGVGIEILGCESGFIFTGCQIFFSKINIVNSLGIVVSGCNFGKNNCDITVSGGGAILFANNMHQDAPPAITITGNDNVHFVNCYNRETGAVIQPNHN